jgi:CelD/BcsL family acetyltransferase involved in cellulose biosynthesis
MLERGPIAISEFTLDVHRAMPADWPGIRSGGEARAHVFQTREFLAIWAQTFGTALAVDARFIDVRDGNGALVLRIPLAIETRRGVRILSFADHSCADYNAPIVYPNAIDWTADRAQSLWRAIEAALPPVDIVRLEKVPAMVGDLVNPLHLLGEAANPESAHGSNMRLAWPEIEATQAQLKTLKRKARGLQKLGEVKFTVASDKAERDRILSKLLQQKQRRYEDTRVPGFAENPMQKRFFEIATEDFAALGNLHLSALEVGGEIIATNWSVSMGRTIYELMIGFESGEWVKHSGGRILNLRFLEWAKAQGFDYVDHGIGDEDWKIDNCDTHVPLGLLVAARSAKGRRALARDAFMARLRGSAAYQRLRPYKWIVKRALRRAA